MTSTAKPTFATNRLGERVADAINAHLEYLRSWSKDFEVAIATAYFNPGGFGLLADEMERSETCASPAGGLNQNGPSNNSVRLRSPPARHAPSVPGYVAP